MKIASLSPDSVIISSAVVLEAAETVVGRATMRGHKDRVDARVCRCSRR